MFETEGVGEAILARARREAQAMGKLGAHPHIVGIVESGEDGTGPYIVSEHMPGGDVAGLLAGAERRRLDAEQAISIAVDVTRGLEHAHGCGIVHRDLKPANVWLGDDGRARLGDFGLALTSEGRSRAEPDGTLVGTVAYLPPEQALGRSSDARSDLYSLGALLYEMLTGQPPFPGDDAVAIMGQHLSETPVPPSKLRPELPTGVDDLVLRLLAKQPDERPANAAEARRALESLDLTPPTAQLVEAEENPLDRLAGGVFVGRERELAELRAAVDEARGGAGGLVLLVGEPGIGKTRTAEEVATYARVQGARVHWGHCHEGEGVPPYWPWAEAIRSYVRDADPVGLAWELGSGAAEIARIVPELREQAGAAAEAGADEHEEARFRLFDAVATFLSGAARSRPLVLVLDDLHWADEPSLLLLRFLARGFGDSPLLIVGTYRDVELGRHHPLARTLSELAGAERTTRVQLRGLDSAAVERYIEMSTGTEPAPGLADAVLEQTEGNPFFVSEVVRLLASERRLEAGAATAGSWLPQIPQGVREVVGRRLDRLSEAANSVLAVAAAIGRVFDLDVLERACEDCDSEQVIAALDESAAARIVTDAGPRRFSFSHALVRETLYAEIPATRRAAVHGRIAAAIEELYGDDRAMLSALAHQFLEAAPAGDPLRAAEYARLGGGAGDQPARPRGRGRAARAGPGRAGARARLGTRAAARDRTRAGRGADPRLPVRRRARDARGRRSDRPRARRRRGLRPRRVRCRGALRSRQLRPRDRRARRGGARGRRGGGGEPALAAPVGARRGVLLGGPGGQGRAAQRRGARAGPEDRRRRGDRERARPPPVRRRQQTRRARGSASPRPTRSSRSAAAPATSSSRSAPTRTASAPSSSSATSPASTASSPPTRASPPGCASPSTSGTSRSCGARGR